MCQEGNSEKLRCPGISKKSSVGAGYAGLADDLILFSNSGCLTNYIDIS